MSLRARAPRLPPSTSNLSTPLRPTKRSLGSATAKKALRKGLPTQTPLLSTWGKAQKMRSATPANTRLARPATEFCSCSTKGLPHSTPIMPPGKLTKPPSPTSTSGLTRRTTSRLCQKARNRRSGSRARVSQPLPRTPEKSIGSKANPCGGTSSLSMLACLAVPLAPSQCTRQPRSRRARASASPGKICPPVPPAMMSAVRCAGATAALVIGGLLA